MSIADFPKAYRELFQPKRWKVYYGGRDAAKSWNFARALLIQATQEPLRVLCCREVMRTLADSVHQLLQDQIKALGLEDFYTITETEIVGKNGARFAYAGLRAMDVHKVKSFEGCDVAWVEEAQTVSEKSWLTLENTIRVDGSEIWVSFNPDLDSDPTYVRFVVLTQPESIVRKVTWRDNPFYSRVLEPGRNKLRETDPVAYDNVWEGNPRAVVEGAIYATEVRELIESKRIRMVPYDPMLKVHTIWDLGWNDQTSIILAQRGAAEVRIIDYIEDRQKTLAEYAGMLQQRKVVWGHDWLPHDGESHSIQTGKSPKEILKSLGRSVRIIPKLDVESGIKAARMMFPRCYFDEKANRLVDCLKRYKRAVPETTGEPGRPVHDEHSHGADAFRGLAVIVDKMSNDDRGAPPPVKPWKPHVPGIGM